MTQSSYFLTNGSSLEDCHTNFFALADLCGIKWRQYTSDKHGNDLSEDPVLHSYSRCINAELLCVWRRVRNNTHDQPSNHQRIDGNYVNYTKELWIFWYGEDPDFTDIIVGSLTDGENGSWETGLSYECRTLLFKALHNLIEKLLLSKGYSRLGRWFFQVKYAPNGDKSKSDILNDGTQVTFSFNFFLHGDSNVCANVDVRQHATILPLSKEDLHAAQSIPGGLRVILAPFGLQAYLTGHVYKENDPTVQKLFSDWKKIYPISSPKNAKGNGSLHHISPHFNHLNDGQRKSSDEDYLNRVVELLVGDHRLKYPFSYVFINEADRKLRQLKSDSKCKSSSTTETLSQAYKRSEEILENCPLMMTPYYQQTPNDTYCLKSSTNQAIKFCDSLILEKVHSSSREDGSNESGHTLLNGDLLQKKACNCPKCQQANLKKQLKSSSLNGLSSSYNQFSSSSKSKDRTLEKERAKYLKNCAPFHLRSSLSLSPPDEEFTSSLLQSQAAAAAAASAAAASSPSTVNLNSSMNQSNATPIIMSYKSPVSTSTSSILNTPGIESSPLSNFNCDAVEHTSPNASKDESTSINTPINISNQLNQSPKDKTSCLTSTMSPSVNPNLFSNTTATTDANSLNGLGSKGTNIAALSSAAELVKSETTTSCGTTTAAFAPTQQSTSTANTNDKPASCQSLPLKRSFLYRNVYDGDHDLRHGLLYDYSCESELDWDLPLPKNRRINDGSTTNGHLLDLNRDFADNYAFHELPPFFKSKDSFEFNGIDDHDFASKLHLDPLMEKISQNNVTVPTTINGTLIEPSAANNNTNNNKSTKAKDTNTEVAAKAILNAKSSAFARNDDDYTGTFSDFEIFNSSGDESNENFQAPLTPKNSNGPSSTAALAESDSYTTTSNTASLSSSSSILGPAELSRMFPTPPSLEAMVASPCNTYVTADSKSDKVVESAPVELATDNKKEPSVQNSVEEEQKDCSFVYKPPVQSSFITSNKYAPLENVECKQSLPTHCYYKHNTKKQQQAMKPFGLVPPQSQSLSANLIASNKSQLMNTKGGLGGFTSNQAMIRNVRPSSQNMPGFNNSPFMGRARPPLGMQSQMFTFPSDNFRQNSPSLNIDSSSMSPSVACSFISSPVPSFDNRKSPYSFPQSVSHNSPSNSSAFMSNSPLNNFNNSMQQKTISPMVGSGNFFNSVNSTNPNNNSHAMEGGSISATDAAVTTPHFEVNALMLNLMLSDSMFNLFRDHNFESCSICVCNMNIKGNDVGVYLPDPSPQQSSNYDYYQCTCGFSALSNRHLSQFSGLFYEDEVEITGIYYDPSERKLSDTEESNGFFDKDLKKALGEVDENVIDLLVSLSTTIFPSSSTFSKLINCDRRPPFKTFNLQENSMRLFERDLHKFVYKDFTDVIMQSLNMTRTDAAVTTSKQANMLLTSSQNLPLNASRPVLHDWSFRNSNFPVNNHEVIHMLKTLQPLMQEAVQRKGSATGSEVTYNSVKGPLTWRQFHRLAGRGTEYQCEPQPIPSLLAGYDKDCVVVSPFALKFWEKLSLEPYAVNRDIGYIALVPDNEYISSKVKLFLRELSTTYELLRFGRHFPMRKLFKDGLCVVSSSNAKKSDSVPLDDWFNNLGESNLATKIRLYAQTCCNLVPSLSVYERSLFESSPSKSFSEVPNSTSALNSSSSSSSFMNNNSSGNNSGGNNTASMNGNLSNSYMSSMFGGNVNSQQRPMNNFGHVTNSSESSTIERLLNNNSNNESDSSGGHGGSNDPSICSISAALQPYEDEDDMHKFPAIVIYIVDPFGAYGKEAAKLGCVGLLKSFAHMLKFIPENVRNNVHVQLLSIDSILCNDRDFRNISRQNQLKELAFSIYSQCKQQLIFQPNIKSLTGLGPAASFEVFLKGKDPLYNKTQLYTTPFILAPLKDKQTELGEMFGDRREKSQILFCCYCLSEDQKWLLVSCTNDKGDILQSKVINVHVPNRTRRRNAAVRRFGLDKLMSFVQTVMSESVLPWRLVIGRLGRIGHGELKDWTSLLSKKSLLKYSRQLRDLCAQCHDLSPHDQPAIYSACLISLEADTALRVFPNYYTPDERFSSSCNTCSLSTPEDASCTHILVFPTSATTQSSHANFSMMDIGANLGEEFFGNLDETDIPVEDDIDFDNFWNDPLLDDGPRRDEPAPGSPGNRQSFGASSLKNSNPLDDQDEPAQLLQQPLALAFYVSTARTGPLPRWFWANSPHLENTCPVFLKSALLIHTPFVQQNTDDLLHSNNRDCHSLDSSLTTDVLRCVLEGYNSLSWLALDPGTNDRMSCLPLHIQVLMQLYHSVQALI